MTGLSVRPGEYLNGLRVCLFEWLCGRVGFGKRGVPMRMRRLLFGGILMTCVLTAAVEQQRPLEGCAPAPHRGQWVDIRDESALIIWDEVTKTEHFIRRASFETAADDFGFLVPTPTQPDLGEADDRVF